MKYCSRCGAACQEDAQFCAHCGTRFAPVTYAVSEPPYIPSSQPAKEDPPKSSGKGIAGLLLGILGLLLALPSSVLILLYLANAGDLDFGHAVLLRLLLPFLGLILSIVGKSLSSSAHRRNGFAVVGIVFNAIFSGIVSVVLCLLWMVQGGF